MGGPTGNEASLFCHLLDLCQLQPPLLPAAARPASTTMALSDCDGGEDCDGLGGLDGDGGRMTKVPARSWDYGFVGFACADMQEKARAKLRELTP